VYSLPHGRNVVGTCFLGSPVTDLVANNIFSWQILAIRTPLFGNDSNFTTSFARHPIYSQLNQLIWIMLKTTKDNKAGNYQKRDSGTIIG
jgi:hypothetical protein